MSARMASGHLRHITHSSIRTRHASTATIRQTSRPRDHGQQIYVYSHLQTNQVVYSLTKALKNNPALKQLPFNGKKTVPRALRKDLWSPLAQISFAPGAKEIGLSAFQKLREYRRRHELEWGKELMTDANGMLIAKKKRGRQINDQKANSIADISKVLGSIGTEAGRRIGLKMPATTADIPGAVVEGAAAEGEESGEAAEDELNLRRVEVKWINMMDAEFAATWSKNVTHDKLEWAKNNRDPEYWDKRWAALDAYKAREALKSQNLSYSETGTEQDAGWEQMEEKRREWYASQGKLDEFKPRKMVAAKDEPSEEEKIRIAQKSDKRKLARQEKAKKELEKAKKQAEYWADMDKKREEWYASQDKTEEMQARKLDPLTLARLEKAHKVMEQEKYWTDKAQKDAEKARKQAEYWAIRDKERAEWYASQGKLDEMKPRKVVEEPSTSVVSEKQGNTDAENQSIATTPKPTPEGKEKQQEVFRAAQDNKRAEWYASQGKSAAEMKARRSPVIEETPSLNKSPKILTLEEKQTLKKMSQEEQEEKEKAFWALEEKKRQKYLRWAKPLSGGTAYAPVSIDATKKREDPTSRKQRLKDEK